MKANRLLAAVAACMILATAAQSRAPRKSRIKPALRKAPAAAPSGDAALDTGLKDLRRKQYTPAIVNFQQAARFRGDGASFFLLGYAYYQRGFMSGAPETADKQDALGTVNAYAAALALDPSLEQVAQPYKFWHSLAMSYEALGSDEKAMDAYKKAFESAPANPLLPLYAARLRFKMGDVDKSVNNFKLALIKARETRQDRAVVAVVKTNPLFARLLSSPDHARMLQDFDSSIAASAGTVAAADAAGRASFAAAARAETMGDSYGMRDAVRESAAAARPSLSQRDQAVLDQLASAAEDYKFRRYRQAVVSYGEVLLLNQQSGVLNPTQLAMVHERLGTAYERLGQTTQAVQELQRALQEQPFNTAAQYQLALAYSVAGQYRDSLHALNEAFRTAPTRSDLRRYMLLAKTDAELEPIRDLPAFQKALADYGAKLGGIVR